MNTHFLPKAALGLVLAAVNVEAADLVHNDFSNGNTSGWSKGGGTTIPLTIETEADGNKYMKLKTATEEGAPDTKVTFHNGGKWKGNYNTKGVKSVSARFNNRGAEPLEMHFAIRTEVADLSTRYVVIKGATIPADKQWHNATFSLADADMQLVDKSGHGGSELTMPVKQVKNRVVQVRFTNGTLGEKTGNGHGEEGVYTGWNDGRTVDTEVWIDDIKLSTDSAGAPHMHN